MIMCIIITNKNFVAAPISLYTWLTSVSPICPWRQKSLRITKCNAFYCDKKSYKHITVLGKKRSKNIRFWQKVALLCVCSLQDTSASQTWDWPSSWTRRAWCKGEWVPQAIWVWTSHSNEHVTCIAHVRRLLPGRWHIGDPYDKP